MKKWLMAALTAVCLVCLALGLAACVPEGLTAHSYEKEWSHTFEEHWHVCTDPGCSSRGSLGAHDWRLVESMVEEQPTCGNPGWGRYVCIMCGATKDDVIPATGEHSYSFLMDTTPATCIEDGQSLWLCDVCGALESRTAPATGEHVFAENWSSDAEGHYHVCENCGAKDEVIPHKENNPEQKTTQPSGVVDGKTEYLCPDCKYVLRSEPITNPNIAVYFDIAITLNGGRQVEVTETNDRDAYGNTILHAALWAKNTFPAGMIEGMQSNYQIGFIGKNVNGGSQTVTHSSGEQSQYRMECYLCDVYTGKERELDINIPGFIIVNGSLPFIFNVQNYDAKNPENNNYMLVFRYYTISGAVKQFRAERSLSITVLRYGEEEKESAKILSRETVYIQKKRED